MNDNSKFNVLVCRYKKVEEWNRLIALRPHWRIYWNPTPGAKITCRGEDYYPDAGHIVAIPPNIPIDQIMEEPFEHFFLHVSIDFPYHLYPDLVYFPIGEHIRKNLRKIVEKFQKSQSFSNWSDHCKNLVYSIIYRVITELDEEKLFSRRISSIVTKSMQILDKSIINGVNNQKLAEMAGLSLSAYLAKFTREVGQAPQQYLLQKRLQKSLYMLSASAESIDQIAVECGFCERSYFSRLFKREYGISPARFRKFSCE